MRDIRKPKEYFDSYVDKEKARINDFEDSLEKGEIKETRILPVRRSVEMFRYHMMVARYSRGDSVESLIDDYKICVHKIPEVGDQYSYGDLMNLLSIGIMMEIDDETFEILSDHVLKYMKDDWLLKYLIHYRRPEVAYHDSPLWLKKFYQRTQDVIESEMPEEAMKLYLNKWYQSNQSNYWYGRHNSAQNTYFGYWAFEAGAIVKIMGIDDTLFKDSPYYPYDLVHYEE